METLYRIKGVEFVNPKVKKVAIPPYASDLVFLKHDLLKKSKAEEVIIKFDEIKRDYSKFKALRGDRDAFIINSSFQAGVQKPSSNVIGIINSVEWIESIEERDMWLGALMEAEAWGKK